MTTAEIIREAVKALPKGEKTGTLGLSPDGVWTMALAASTPEQARKDRNQGLPTWRRDD